MTRVIRFDAPPPRGSDPRINAYRVDAGYPLRRPDARVDSKELLALTKRLTKGGLAPTELAAIQRRLDEMKSVQLSKGVTADIPAVNGPPKPGATLSTERMLAMLEQLKSKSRDPAELLAMLEELGATGKLSPAEMKALRARVEGSAGKQGEPAEVIDSGRDARGRTRSDELAARLVAKGRASLPPLVPNQGAPTAKGDRADDSPASSSATIEERLVARGRAPLGER